TVLTARAKVECGETYHLVISIADAIDGVWDSGIFLEANSLGSFAPIEMTSHLSTNAYANHNLLAEGCETATVTIKRSPSISSTALTIPVTILGTATEGVDYSNLPNSVTFAPGQTQVSFSFDVFADMIAEGDETVIIQLD